MQSSANNKATNAAAELLRRATRGVNHRHDLIERLSTQKSFYGAASALLLATAVRLDPSLSNVLPTATNIGKSGAAPAVVPAVRLAVQQPELSLLPLGDEEANERARYPSVKRVGGMLYDVDVNSYDFAAYYGSKLEFDIDGYVHYAEEGICGLDDTVEEVVRSVEAIMGGVGVGGSGGGVFFGEDDDVSGEEEEEDAVGWANADGTIAIATGIDTLAMLGIMLISVLLLFHSGLPTSSSNLSFYKTISYSKKKTMKRGAWKVIVIALVSCYLVQSGTADTGNKAEAEKMIAGESGLGVYLTSDVPGEKKVHNDEDKTSGTLKLRGGELDFLLPLNNVEVGEADEDKGDIGELDFLMFESADLLTSDNIKLGEADKPGFIMHKELADFFDMIEDDEKYAIWEKEEMPKTLALMEMETGARKGRSRKQKNWARKAIAKAEIDSCWRQKKWKDACYPMKCRRWEHPWWWAIGYCAGGYYCNGRDRNILGCCHQDCGGWSDDGSSCTKSCSSQSMTPYTCSHLQCATDWQSCAVSALKMAFSIVDMLSSICPASRLRSLATKVAKAASTYAKKALLKTFAKAVAVKLMKKAKRKAKKFMKDGTKYLAEYAVDSILQEAAEAFAIERARKEPQFQTPSFEDVARAIDPIGVSGVVDAFNLDSCNSAEIERFPGCFVGLTFQKSFGGVYWWIEDNCCGEVHNIGHAFDGYYFMFCYPAAGAGAEYYLSDVSEFNTNTTNTNTTDIDDFDDDGFYSDSNNTFVDIINEKSVNVTMEVMFLCNECSLHTACLDNEIETADLTFYNACEAAGCCGDESPGEVPDLDLHIENVLKIIRSGNETSDEADACEECDMFCDDTTMQQQHPMFYDHCMSNSCCPQM